MKLSGKIDCLRCKTTHNAFGSNVLRFGKFFRRDYKGYLQAVVDYKTYINLRIPFCITFIARDTSEPRLQNVQHMTIYCCDKCMTLVLRKDQHYFIKLAAVIEDVLTGSTNHLPSATMRDLQRHLDNA